MSVKEYFARHVRLRHLRLLVAIDYAGRLTVAANAMHVTQPALSKALTELENLVGEALFERTPQGLVATRSGAAMIRAARHVLTELDRASQEMQQLETKLAKTLILGAMPTTAISFLGAALALFSKRNPGVTVRVVDEPMPLLLPKLVAGRLDLIVGGQVRSAVPEGIRTVDLYTDLMQIAMSKHHPLARSRSTPWHKLLEYPWVLPPPTNALSIEFYSALRRLNLNAPTNVIEALGSDMTITLMEESQALSFLPKKIVTVLASRGTLRPLGGSIAQELNVRMAMKLFLPSAEADQPVIQELITCINQTLVTTRK